MFSKLENHSHTFFQIHVPLDRPETRRYPLQRSICTFQVRVGSYNYSTREFHPQSLVRGFIRNPPIALVRGTACRAKDGGGQVSFEEPFAILKEMNGGRFLRNGHHE